MSLDHPDNPSTSFDGISREPTNAEMLANLRALLVRAPLVFLWLAIEGFGLREGWALLALKHALPVWCVLMVLTFWREMAAFLLTLAIAFVAGVKAFAGEFARATC